MNSNFNNNRNFLLLITIILQKIMENYEAKNEQTSLVQKLI